MRIMKQKLSYYFYWLKTHLFDDTVNLTITLTLFFYFFTLFSLNPVTLIIHPLTLFLKLFIVIGVLARIATHYAFWLVITILLAFIYLPEWYKIDNHEYLIIYWSLSLAVALYSATPKETLQKTAALLLGLCFFFATFWKVITPEFMNGSFFQFLLAGGDTRFHEFSMMISGMDKEMISSNRSIFYSLKEGNFVYTFVLLELTEHLHLKALTLTWSTIILEGAIALLFLINTKMDSPYLKHGVLILFIVTTYPVAPVISFGLLLVCIGISQSKNHKIKFLYIVIFTFLHLLKFIQNVMS